MASTRIVLSSLVVIGAIAALVTAATMAVFSDQVISDGNTFAAGTLYMSVDGECGGPRTGSGGDGGGDPCNLTSVAFTVTNMQPGDSSSHPYAVVNEGSLPGTLTVSASETDASNCFNVTIDDDGPTNLDANGGANDSTTVTVTVELPESANNTCQAASGSVEVTFTLDQQA